MADNPHLQARRPRPLSPFVTIYSWPVTMASSITHRVTGVGLALGMVLVAWWLVALSLGAEAFNQFIALAATPLGELILFGFTWALAYHFLNGIRHLAWDLGYGFAKDVSRLNSALVIGGSVVLAVAIFVLAYTGHGGYYR